MNLLKTANVMMNNAINLKEITCLVIDDGMFIHFAQHLAKSYGKTYYHNPENNKPADETKDFMVGYGLEDEGLFYTDDFWKIIDEIDLFVFTNLGHRGLQLYLEEQGKLVWGARNGQELEMYRKLFKDFLKQVDLPVPEYEVITGMSDLREYLKDNEDVYIKSTRSRGDFETFHSENYSIIESYLDDMESRLGPRKSIIEFIVEQPIAGEDVVEGGIDTYCIDGKYPKYAFCGYEIKDCAFCGRVMEYKNISPLLKVVNDKIADTLGQYGARGDISTEVRVGKDKVSYFTDITLRKPEPPTSVLENIYSNWAEIVLMGAMGVLIDPVPVAKYGMQAMIYSDWADDHSTEIMIDPKVKDFVKMKNLCKINGKYYHVAQKVDMPQIGAVVATGDSVEECVKKIKQYAEGIKGFDIKINLSDLDKAVEVMKKGEKLGIVL